MIAGLFWGHTHEDQHMIYYANNGTKMSAGTAQNVGWIGPPITPLTDRKSRPSVLRMRSKITCGQFWLPSI